MPTLHNVVTSARFSIIKTFVDIFNRGDWDACIAALPKDFVFEFVVFDGPNLCFTRDRIKAHLESIPGFRLGKATLIHVIEGDDQVFIRFTTETRFMRAPPPAGHYELFVVVHVKEGQVKRLEVASDSKTISEIVLTPDAV